MNLTAPTFKDVGRCSAEYFSVEINVLAGCSNKAFSVKEKPVVI